MYRVFFAISLVSPVGSAADSTTGTLVAHHDINANGKMERHRYGQPKEPSGASNDAPAKFGPPEFKHAKFTFDVRSLQLTVTVK